MTTGSRFPSCPLTAAQEKQFRSKASVLLNKAIQDCDRTLADIDQQWKYVRMHQGLKVYKAKNVQTAPSELMVTGIVRGSLHDVMKCMYSDDSFHFRLNSALLMPKEHLDCEVLHAIDIQNEMNPFKFNGVKWCATKWPGGTMNKPRDMCYFESTGITQARDSAGQLLEYGYSIMESIELPQCPHLDVYSIIRAKISIRHIFRELPIGCTMVMTHCTVDPSGSLPTWMSDFSTLPHLLAISRAVDVSESIQLSKALLDHVGISSKEDTSRDWGRLSLFSKKNSECCLCDKGDQFKLEKKRIVEAVGAGVKMSTKYFCPHCITACRFTASRNPIIQDIDVSYLDNLNRPSVFSKQSSVTLYSDELSDDMSELSSIVEETRMPPPILDFDDDEVEESMYSGIEFDYRSTCLSESLTSCDTILFENSPSNSTQSISPSVLAQQLVHLNMQMDNTYDIMQRNRVRMDSLQSTASSA